MTSSPPSPLSNAQQQGEQRQRVSVYAPAWDAYDGYGRMALELVWHLAENDVSANVLTTPNGKILYENQSDAIQELLSKPHNVALGGFMLGYPTLREQYSGLLSAGQSVAITMFESTGLPEGWVESLNQCAAVIVPARWCVEAFKANGVKVPIHLVPLGVSESFYPVRRTRGVPFTFMCWGDRGTRKGWDLAFQAFHKAFGERSDVRLIIKTRKGAFPYDPTAKHPNIEVMELDLDEKGLQAFYASVDCMVFPSRGEGFGLPPREFAATGGAVICTKWWADDIPLWGYPVNYTMVPAWEGHERFEGLGEWAECDIEHLAQQMRHVFSQNPGVIEYMGIESAKRIRKLYSWEKFALDCWAIWNDPLHPATVKANCPRKGDIQAGRERRKARQHASHS